MHCISCSIDISEPLIQLNKSIKCVHNINKLNGMADTIVYDEIGYHEN